MGQAGQAHTKPLLKHGTAIFQISEIYRALGATTSIKTANIGFCVFLSERNTIRKLYNTLLSFYFALYFALSFYFALWNGF
ncbi:hypothetical protein ANCCAN_04219 [Ancylostoma caninum]|uniref:Uncharacterized protein n=1 Tax=Ancylostoma caninum TaxID=29170 RepID=A0A368GZI9_ANCCA|nr:hypothetical protein ANCCAN_04219 [Ancylostoma caninum]